MPAGYSLIGADNATNYTTSGTANTEVDHLRTLTVAARGAAFTGLYVAGKGAGLTAISGIAFRLKRFSTASTVGSALTPHPKDPLAAAAQLTAFTAPTLGTTATIVLFIGCGAAGPGGWVAPNPDQAIVLSANGGANGNLDLFSVSGTASLNFEWGMEEQE